MIEMIVNGASSLLARNNPESIIHLASPNDEVRVLPNIDCIRKVQRIIRIAIETLVACELAKNKEQKQFHDNGASRRQTSLQDFIASAMKNNSIRPILLNSYHMGSDEKSGVVLECIEEAITNGKFSLHRQKIECKELYPAFHHDAPGAEDFSLSNFSKVVVANDARNQACEIRRLSQAELNEEGEHVLIFIEYLSDVCTRALVGSEAEENSKNLVNNNDQLDVDYYFHLKNVWINMLHVNLCEHTEHELSEDLKDVDRNLHAKIEMDS